MLCRVAISKAPVIMKSNTISFNKVLLVNGAGVMFSDRVILPAYSSVTPIYFDKLKSLKMSRHRSIIVNILSLIFSALLCIAAIMLSSTALEQVFSFSYSLIFLFLGIFYKNVSYKIWLTYSDYSLKEIRIKRHLKEDTKNMVNSINKLLRNNK
ncbi:hypothetical protein CHU92_03360 [Flavobacterium cyanobacteriorum]|uniref:Uncharacterized protein n=1 Tax=Flavobacterium cyanobacteriorum TaxID=2022802 RepID=A0A255ZQ18_9FLAO|nr:hypothetical protein CHU92_03360 [Flavobacterium cyanobacteriorum]